MTEDGGNTSFWTSLEGILTGLAAVIGAVTALYLALNSGSPDTDPLGREPIPPDTADRGLAVSEWSTMGEATFTQGPEGGWTGSSSTEETPTFDVRVVEGSYRWDVRYSTGWRRMIPAPYSSAVDFGVSVDVKFVQVGQKTAAGMIFGYGETRHYFVSIDSNGNWSLLKSNHDQMMLVEWTPITAAFDPGGWNRIRVTVDRQVVRFYVNSEYLGEYRIPEFSGGKVGLVVTMWQHGAAVVDFDNFVFRRKL